MSHWPKVTTWQWQTWRANPRLKDCKARAFSKNFAKCQLKAMSLCHHCYATGTGTFHSRLKDYSYLHSSETILNTVVPELCSCILCHGDCAS